MTAPGPQLGTGRVRPNPAVPSVALVTVCLGYFVVILDATIVTVALPALGADLHANVSGLQWVVDGYLLMLAAPAALRRCARRPGRGPANLPGRTRAVRGRLGRLRAGADRRGLVAARLLQGVGAALTVPASLALLRAAYPDQAARTGAIGVWGGIAGVAAAGGPVLGGVLVTAMSWRLVFFVNVPIGLAAMALTARHVPAPAPQPRGLDFGAQATAVLALAAATLALIEVGHRGFTPLVGAAGALCLAAVVAFVAIEGRVRAPMLPLELFGNSTFSGGNAVGLLINLGFYGELFVVNLYFQQVLGYSALLAGVALLPQMGMATIASLLSGRFTARAGGPRPTMLLGLAVGAAGLLGLTVAGARTPYLLLVGPLLATGFGMAFTMPAATTAVLESAPAERTGLASGAINAARQVGGVIGVALLGALVGGGSFIPGLRIALVIAGAAFLAGAAITAGTVHKATR